MNFKFLLSWLWLFPFAGAHSFSQSPQEAKTDSIAAIEPFEGIIGYNITYSDGNAPGIRELLPDSMAVIVKYPWIRVKWFGGMSDTLLNDAVWYATTNNYYLIDHNKKVVYLLPPSEDSTLRKATNTKETAKVAGENCTKYTLKSGAYLDTWMLTKKYFIQRSTLDTLNFGRPPFLAAGRNEIPLKAIRKGPEGTVTSTATSIQKMVLDESLFRYPADYELSEFDRLRRHHPLMQE